MNSDTNTDLLVTMLVTGTIIFAVIVIIFIIVRCYYKRRLASTTLYFTTSEPESVTWEYKPDRWEVPIQEIEVIKPVARGSFGSVYLGCWKKNNQLVQCALKTTEKNNSVYSRKLLTEASIMKELCCCHVVRLYGIVSQTEPVIILTEFMQQGDLRSFLRLHLDKEKEFCFDPPSLKDILRIAIEIADGMSYLAYKRYVHRDLSASHCLVSANNITKVAGFGLTKDIYQKDYYKEDSVGMMPIRWMAPESLHTGLFTYSSDVWSFGVLLWELATLGSDPYKDENDKDVISFVTSGGIMERPNNCPDILYDYMKYCWCFKATSRPSFRELVKRLLPCARPDFANLSFFHNGIRLEHLHRVGPLPQKDIEIAKTLKKEYCENEHGSKP